MNCLSAVGVLVHRAKSRTVGQAGKRIRSGLEAQFLARRDEVVLQIQNTRAHAQTSVEFGRIEGLSDVIVGARLEPFDQIPPLGAGRQQQNIDIRAI